MAQSMSFSNRKSLKRNCQDLEDSDESLPISKRINSLHIEGQSNILSAQLQNGHALAGFPDNGAAALSEASVQQHFIQSPVPHRLEQNNCASTALRVPHVNGHQIPSPQEANSTHNAYTGSSNYSALMGNPAYLGHHQGASSHRQSHLPHELLLNNNDSQSLGYHPYSPTKAFLNGANSPTPGSSQSPFQDLGSAHNPFFQNGQLSAFQNVQCKRVPSFEGSPLESMSFTNQSPEIDFHLQQLPSGNYEPELGVSENPYYFSINQLLYEAHLSRVRRDTSFSGNS